MEVGIVVILKVLGIKIISDGGMVEMMDGTCIMVGIKLMMFGISLAEMDIYIQIVM